jgi:hypothetical protein
MFSLARAFYSVGNFFAKREQAAKARTREGAMEKQRQQFATHFRSLLEFVNWMNTRGFANRHVRKDFWSRVARGERVLEAQLEDMIRKYEEDAKAGIAPK